MQRTLAEARPVMDWDDYFRQQATMYRELAQKTEDSFIKQELLELAASAKRSLTISRIVRPAANDSRVVAANTLRARRPGIHRAP